MAKAKLIIQPITQKTGPQPAEQFSWLTSDPYLSSQPQPASQPSSREVEISGSVSIGRAPDNTICLPDDRVARYHAIIEERGGVFWLNDFGSTGGTLLNDAPVMSERPLRDGDVIMLANAVRLSFRAPGLSDRAQPQNHAPAPPIEQATAPIISVPAPAFAPAGNPAPQAGAATGTSQRWLWVIPVAILLVILGGGWLAIRVFFFEKECGRISFAMPSAGATFSGPLKIKLNADQSECIQEVNFSIDGQPFGSVASGEPFEIQLDQQRLQDLQAGPHTLTATATTGGGKLEQNSITLKLNYEPKGPGSLDEIRAKASVLATEIEEGGGQLIFDPEFIQQIARATAGFVNNYNDPAFQRASSQKEDILYARSDQGLHHPAVGFILAFSRSQFSENGVPQGCGVEPGSGGFWRVPPQIAQPYGGDQAVNQAKVALAHLRSLRDAAEGDLLYAIACFGEPNARMPELTNRFSAKARRDPWAVYRAGGLKEEEKNRLVCFFAAGIVAENPQLFDNKMRSIAELYK
ncbi:MAG: FHA domain-containing protein [Acidobacteriota bacterium]